MTRWSILSSSLLIQMLMSSTALAKTTHTFLPENDLWREDKIGFSAGGISRRTFDQLIDKAMEIYTPIARKHREYLEINKDWANHEVNARTHREGNKVVIDMYGGMARRPELIPEAFVNVICHELGHAYGGEPFVYPEVRLSADGQADYWGAKSCLRRMLPKIPPSAFTTTPYMDKVCAEKFADANHIQFCRRALAAGQSLASLLAALDRSRSQGRPRSEYPIPGPGFPFPGTGFPFPRHDSPEGIDPDDGWTRRCPESNSASFNLQSPNYETPDMSEAPITDTQHPGAQCRLDTYFRAVLLMPRPACWYKDDGMSPFPSENDEVPPVPTASPSPTQVPTPRPEPTALPTPIPVPAPEPTPVPPTTPTSPAQKATKLFAMAFIKKDPDNANLRQKISVTLQNHENYPVFCKSIEMSFFVDDGDGQSLGIIPILLRNIEIASGEIIAARDESYQLKVVLSKEFPRYSIKENINTATKYNCFESTSAPNTSPAPSPTPVPIPKPEPRSTPRAEPRSTPNSETSPDIPAPAGRSTPAPEPNITPIPQPGGPFDDIWVEIKNARFNTCLTASGDENTAEKGAPLRFSTCEGQDNQKFWLFSTNGLIKISGNSLCLSMTPDGKIIQDECKTITSQRFVFAFAALGGHEVRLLRKLNTCVTVSPNGDVEMKSCKTIDTQLMQIRDIRSPDGQ